MKEYKELSVVVYGHIAAEAARLYAKENKESCAERLPGHMVKTVLGYSPEEPEIPAEMIVIPLEEGGIYEGLWKLFAEYRMGFDIDLRAVPVRQESVEICELADEDPYSADSKGAFLGVSDHIFVPGEADGSGYDGWKLIGRTRPAPAKVLRIDDRIRYLDKPESFKYRIREDSAES